MEEQKTERDTLSKVHEMCIESLPPELFKQWEVISESLKDTRKELKLMYKFTTSDGVEIDPRLERCYYYPKWATDGVPSFGYLNLIDGKWCFDIDREGLIFSDREAVMEHIASLSLQQ